MVQTGGLEAIWLSSGSTGMNFASLYITNSNTTIFQYYGITVLQILQTNRIRSPDSRKSSLASLAAGQTLFRRDGGPPFYSYDDGSPSPRSEGMANHSTGRRDAAKCRTGEVRGPRRARKEELNGECVKGEAGKEIRRQAKNWTIGMWGN